LPGSIITAYDCNLIIGPDLDIGAEDHLDLHRAHTRAKLIAQTENFWGASSGRRFRIQNRVASPQGTHPDTAVQGTSPPSPRWIAWPHLRPKTHQAPQNIAGTVDTKSKANFVPLGSLMSFLPQAAMGARELRRVAGDVTGIKVAGALQMLFWCSPEGKWSGTSCHCQVSSVSSSRRHPLKQVSSVSPRWLLWTMVMGFGWTCFVILRWSPYGGIFFSSLLAISERA
jgi:hypothetical protein